MTEQSENSSNEVVLVDCTFRDGGYYNDWDFPESLIHDYLAAMSRARIPVLELGFRSLERHNWTGIAAHTTDAFLETLPIVDNTDVAAMVNAKELVAFDDGAADAVTTLFAPRSSSRVDMVRIATTWQELDGLDPAVETLRELGYRVAVNMMRAHALSADEWHEFGEWCASKGVEVAYFADSFGCLRPPQVAEITDLLRQSFGSTVGCHLHDNMAMAMANCAEAIRSGAQWIDGTILGMGRGPGNARTEYLAMEAQHQGWADVDPDALVGLVTGPFADLHRDYGWGTNLFYFASALELVHPTPVQELLNEGRYGADEVLQSVRELSASTDRTTVATAQTGPDDAAWDASGWCEDRDLLIVGPGPTVAANRPGIERFIRAQQPLVLMLNLLPQVADNLIDGFVVVNNVRAVVDSHRLPHDSRPVYAPPDVLRRAGVALTESRARPYGFEINAQKMQVGETSAIGPQRLVFAYALALATIGRATSVQTVGIDGFAPGDPRQEAMLEVIDAFHRLPDAPTLISLTPTSYPIDVISVHAPEWFQ